MTVSCKKTKFFIRALQPNITLVSNNDNKDVELYGEAKIKANKRFSNLIVAVNKYVEIFTFGEDHFQV